VLAFLTYISVIYTRSQKQKRPVMKKIVPFLFFIVTIFPLAAQLQAINEPLAMAKSKKAGDVPTIKIFPNPATEYIELTENDKVAKVVVFNLVGKELKRFDAGNGQRYSIGDLPKGLYLVQLLDKNSKTLVTQRVSKR